MTCKTNTLIRNQIIAFARKEDGSLTIFGLVIFVLMMTAGGIALDIMRSEVQRTELQYAVDRASLAAASGRQSRNPEEVVADYMRAAGIDEDSVQVTSTNNGFNRSVTISANAETNSLFLDLLGVETLVQPVSTTAREEMTRLELSLVVDISGSMAGNRIQTLRTAASDFVSELIDGREELTTISLIPYNGKVNAGSTLASVFDLSDEHPHSNCVVFSDTEYQQLGMNPGDELERMAHFDMRTRTNSGSTRNLPGLIEFPHCPTDNYGSILPWSNNVAVLQQRIQALQADGWTATDVGVKWGTLLLDPSSQDELTALVNSPDVPDDERPDSVFIGRPVDYGTDGTHKVLVVMTDGVNTDQWDLKDHRKDGPSAVYVFREALSDVCRNYDPNNARYWWNGRRVDGLSNDDAELCRGWYDAGRPDPFETRLDVPLNVLELDVMNDGVSANGLSVRHPLIDLGRGDPIAVNNYGFNGAACAFGTEEQQALCRARFDDDEGHRWVTRYSVYVPRYDRYWVSHLDQYWYSPYGGAAAQQIDWADAFSSITTSFIANDLMMGADWNTRVDYFNSWETTHQNAAANTNLSNICRTARNAGVIIYTIAFQAPASGRNAMLDCAGPGNEGRYSGVEDLDIASAFDEVVASVDRLRLVSE